MLHFSKFLYVTFFVSPVIGIKHAVTCETGSLNNAILKVEEKYQKVNSGFPIKKKKSR